MPTALLVEDLPAARDALLTDLRDYCPDVEVIGTAGSVVEAAKFLRGRTPDLLFLDILLGDGTSFDLLEIFPELTSLPIFITASDAFAIRAFRFAAVDYLLKPVSGPDLRGAVDRAKLQLPATPAPAPATAPPPNASLELLREAIREPHRVPDRISLHTLENILIVPVRDIVRCEADGNNTRFVFVDRKPAYVTKTLKHYERMLEEHDFLRVHQSHLINFQHLLEFRKRDGGTLLLSNGDEVPVASRKRGEIVERLR